VGQALLNPGKAFPADIRWEAIFDEHLAGLRRNEGAPRLGATGLLRARVDQTMAPAIGAGIDRMVQQVLQRRPPGTMPLQLPAGGAWVGTNGEPDVVGRQIPEH